MPASGCLTVLDADVEEDGGLAVKDTASHSIEYRKGIKLTWLVPNYVKNRA
jgi:hypothetical protein